MVRTAWPRLAKARPRQAPLPAEVMRVAIDAMGGDHAPEATVTGAVLAARELGLRIWLVGHEDVLRGQLGELATDTLPITIHHAPDVIGMDEAPVAAIRRKPRCSLRAAFGLLRSGAVDAVVSAGNSGAVMAGALLTLGGLPGIDRPAIAVSIPAARGQVILLDAGASVDATPSQLVHFAVMGDVYARMLCGISTPRVGLLSNGQEESKGTEATRAASVALRKLSLNYVGYVEGGDVCQGAADVVVCDGFVGNAMLKAIEGFGILAAELLTEALRHDWRGRLAYSFARRGLASVRQRLDYAEYGGAPLLGVNGVTVVAHGRSGPRAIRNAIRVAHDSSRLGVNQRILDAVRTVSATGLPRQRRGRLWAQFRGRLATMRDGHDDAGSAARVDVEASDSTPGE